MKNLLLTSVLLVCFREHNVIALPGPRVYVVTPSPSPMHIDEGRSRPFYYHNWIRRMDNDISTSKVTPPTTKMTPKVKTPDLIFAEFESGSDDSMKKSIRKLLEKEKVPQMPTTSATTFAPIYMPHEEIRKVTKVVNYGVPINAEQERVEKTSGSPTDYYFMYNNLYKNVSSPVFTPSTTQRITMKTLSTTTNAPELHKVENIWDIIDSEKNTQYSGNWEEVPISPNEKSPKVENHLPIDNHKSEDQNNGQDEIDENFVLPGFDSSPGNVAENESRAIRNEGKIRFPYVNLKTFQLKPSNNIMNHKKENSPTASLDSFHDLKNPVRGEAQDVVPSRNIIDRYNPAQPYLPPTDNGSKISKQNSVPTATAMLAPPPPPPELTDNNFPVLTNPYDSFPPYVEPPLDAPPPPPPRPISPNPPGQIYSPPVVYTSDDSDPNSDSDSDYLPDNGPSFDNAPVIDVPVDYKPPPIQQYVPPAPSIQQYAPPAPPIQQYVPPAPPISKPFTGYSYEKPHVYYHHYTHPTTTTTEMPRVNRYSYYYLGKKLYYLPLYFSVYFIVYVGALIIKAVLRHKIVYPNSWRPNGTTATFFSKRSVDAYLSNDNLHEVTGKVTHAIATAAEKYLSRKSKNP